MRKPDLTQLRARPLYGLAGIALLALAAWGLWPRAVEVDIATVQMAAIESGFTEEGKTRLRERFVISAPVDGVVERITLEPGDAVAANAAVAVLRPAPAALLDPLARSDAEMRWTTSGHEVDAARAAVTAALSSRDLAAGALRRVEALAERQQLALDRRDDARSRLTTAEAELRGARARLQAATSRHAAAATWLELQGRAGADPPRLMLASPVDGRVLRRHLQSEGAVRAGQPLLEVGDPAALDVAVEVLTSDALALAPGMRVDLDAGDRVGRLSGRVRVVEPSGCTKISALGVEEQRVLVVVDLPEATQALGDGYRVDARFVVWARASVLAVPVSALFRDGEAWAVYVAGDGRARLRHVDIGHVGDRLAELLGGLSAGERVVIYPGDQVRDGLRIASRPSPGL
jgi:HlyD family secretion protein